MILPLVLLVVDTLVAAAIAYGTHPNWAQYPHGLQLILLTRRLQWPLVALAVILAAALLGLVIGGKRRAWWLIGLAPVMALFIQRFALDSSRAFLVNRQPQFVEPDQAKFVAEDDWVIGVTLAGRSWAYPYACVYSAPLVIQAEQETPFVLMWSPFANRVLAIGIDRTIKPAELEIVSMPANALLIYNSRIGQFINGFTGRQMQLDGSSGDVPIGFLSRLPTVKTTWQTWRKLHPSTLVLEPVGDSQRTGPRRAVLPFFPLPKRRVGPLAQHENIHADSRPGADPAADSNTELRTCALLDLPGNPSIGDTPELDSPGIAGDGQHLLFVHRDEPTGILHVLDRQMPDDLFLSLRRTKSLDPDGQLIDTNTGSTWTMSGRAIDGPLKGQQMKSIEVDDGVYSSVADYWLGDIKPLEVSNLPLSEDQNFRGPPSHQLHRGKH